VLQASVALATANEEILMATYLTAGNDGYVADGGEIVHALEGDDQVYVIHVDDSNLGDPDFDYLFEAEVYGNQGDDYLVSYEFGDRLYGDSGNDTLFGGDGRDYLSGGSGNDEIWTGPSNPIGYGQDDGDVVWAGSGNDIVRLQNADNGDTIRGEDGYDILYLYNSDGLISQFSLIAGGSNSGLLASGFEELHYYGGSGFEVVEGGDEADWITGGGDTDLISGWDGEDWLFGDDGEDVVNGGAGDDNIYGGDDADSLRGNDGDDVVHGDGGNDSITDGAGDDLVLGDAGNDTIRTGSGTDSVHGGDGDDIIREDATDITTIGIGGQLFQRIGGDTLRGDSGNDDIQGGTGHDKIYGDRGNDALDGGEHNDLLDGGDGTDTMRGGAGDDQMYVEGAADVVVEAAGAGSDQVLTSVSYTLAAGVSVELFTTTNGDGTTAINLTGNEVAQTIVGNAGANIINGGAGIDTMQGRAGSDRYYVDNAADVIEELAAGGTQDRALASTSYQLKVGVQVEELITTSAAGTSAINLFGNAFGQLIVGNSGSNIINGLAGTDTLSGYLGNDFFIFDTALGAGNIDTISDFSVADDTVRLENAIFTGLAAGTLAASAFHTGTAAADALDRIIYNSATGALLFDNDGTGAGAAVQFASVSTGLAMTNSDFFVV
jgi:serralysin